MSCTLRLERAVPAGRAPEPDTWARRTLDRQQAVLHLRAAAAAADAVWREALRRRAALLVSADGAPAGRDVEGCGLVTRSP